MTRRSRQVNPKPRRPAQAGTSASDAQNSVEQAEQQPDRTAGPVADAEERPAPGEDERSGQADIERAQERKQDSVETARQEPEDDVGGFLEPASDPSARRD